MNVKKYKSRTLSPVMLKVLQEIDEFGFRTLAELRDGSLQPYGREWCWRIMKRLSDHKLVRPILQSNGSIMGWASNKQTYRFLNAEGIKTKVERGSVPKYSSSFYHDEESRRLLDQFKKLPSIVRILSDSKLKIIALSNSNTHKPNDIKRILSWIPDARLTIKNRGQTYEAAFELERTIKSRERIRNKLEYYIAKSGYDLILYVCANKYVYQSLERNYLYVLENSPAVKFASKRGEVFFCLLDDLKADLQNAKFKGMKSEFCFGKTET